MSTRSRRLLFLLILLALVPLTPMRVAGQGMTTTVIVVRHAERAAEPRDDPSLSAEGKARARALVDAVGKAGISAIYTSQYARTRETAEPLAHELGLQAEAVPITGDVGTAMAELADRIRRQHAGATVLVVGHSNTVPTLVEALGASGVGTIQNHEYDHLFVVLLEGGDNVKLVRARYGG